MTHPDILRTEALGLPEPDEPENWQARELYAAKVKAKHCENCQGRFSDEHFSNLY